MTTRVVRNGTPLDARHDNIAKMLRRGGYDPTLFGYTDQAIDPADDRATIPGCGPMRASFPASRPACACRRVTTYLALLAEERGHTVPVHRGTSTSNGPAPRTAPHVAPPLCGRRDRDRLHHRRIAALAERAASQPALVRPCILSRPHPPFIVPNPFNTLYDPADGLPFARRQPPRRIAPPSACGLLARNSLPRDNHFVIGAGARRGGDPRGRRACCRVRAPRRADAA